MVELASVSKPSPRLMVGATNLTWPSIRVGAPVMEGATFFGVTVTEMLPAVAPPPPSLTVTLKLNVWLLTISPPVWVNVRLARSVTGTTEPITTAPPRYSSVPPPGNESIFTIS